VTKTTLVRRLRAIERSIVQAACDLSALDDGEGFTSPLLIRAREYVNKAHLQTLRTISAAVKLD
jgi:hypothetical protein